MLNRFLCSLVLIAILLSGAIGVATAAEKIAVNSGVDLYSRYIWRGLDIASTPSIQPALSVGYAGLELGAWGAYTLSNNNSASDELDFWLGYTIDIESGASLTLLATDYYFPNAGRKLFNFNNYDAVDNEDNPDPGAHTLELGLSITGPESFPVTLSGYVNVYNDAGHNTYFQFDYPVVAGETEVGFFCGFAGGSKKNPYLYGTDSFNAINVGVSAKRTIKMIESFSLPLTVALILNPKAEITHLVAGMSF